MGGQAETVASVVDRLEPSDHEPEFDLVPQTFENDSAVVGAYCMVLPTSVEHPASGRNDMIGQERCRVEVRDVAIHLSESTPVPVLAVDSSVSDLVAFARL